MKNLKDEIEGILQPMFQYEVQICTKCQHSFGGHYWGAELDSCRHEGCKCVAEHGKYRTEVRNDSVPESYVVELTSLIEQEKERAVEELHNFVRSNTLGGRFMDDGGGYFNADAVLREDIEQYLAERKG